jgi:beta-lactamase class A
MFAKRRRSRLLQKLGVLAVLVVLLAGTVYVASQTSGGVFFTNSSKEGAPSQSREAPGHREEAKSEEAPAKKSGSGKAAPKKSAPDPEQATPEAAAYVALAPELPGTTPQSIKNVYRSKIDKSWASVRVEPEGEGRPFVVFAHWDGESWRAEKSVRADEPDYAKNDVVPLAGVPKDLIQYLYPENVFAAKVPEPTIEKMDLADLPRIESAQFSSTEPVMNDVPESDRERVEKVLGEARQEIEGYNGVAGLYVWDLNEGLGYGIRPDEQFFTASIIKVPVMVAVYRKVDEGKLSFSQQIEIKGEDWAAGAGWLQWEKAGTKQTVGDLLLLMMTQSDNVATNALVRTVGGADHVNEVARSLGAEDTMLYQKVSSERGAVPALDNRSTPRDMATMLQKIAEGKAASEKSCGYMIELMYLDELDWWLDAGLPAGVEAANKAGWLYRVYDDVGIVEHDGHRYVIAILSKHGTANVYQGEALIKNLSSAVWEAQGQPQETSEVSGKSQEGS